MPLRELKITDNQNNGRTDKHEICVIKTEFIDIFSDFKTLGYWNKNDLNGKKKLI